MMFGQIPHMIDTSALSSNSVVLNEFMAHPSASCTEADGEWIELYNASGNWINLSGWIVENSLGEQITLATYLLPPEGYYVLAACGNESLNGGFSADFVYDNFRINNTGRITILSSSRTVVDEIEYNATWAVQAGSSCERINPGWVSSSASSWDYAIQIYGSGDMGTPGSRNSVYSNSFAQNSWAFIKAFVE